MRLSSYRAVSNHLALLSDRQVAELVAGATPAGSGIGGARATLEVEGVQVFVKKVPLTDLDRQPENLRSTANFYRLPTFYQYGIGSTGFGVWRELAVHVMTTNWVLSGAYEGFPLMYHWRVLPDDPQPLRDDLADTEKAVGYWGGSAAIGERLEGLRGASACVAIFLEYLPQQLDEWLAIQVASGQVDAACEMVERELAAGISFMESRGLLHFDAHFSNILTDGERIFFTDFGLAISTGFDLSAAEREFFDDHRTYDWCYAMTHLVRWLIATFHGVEWGAHQAFLRDCVEGRNLDDVPKSVAVLIQRYAPIADVMMTFFKKLQSGSRATPYPVQEIAFTLAAGGR
ncbi:hypothetical protein GCM10009765_41760 [Fodinicola feengrottensis]|uniref:Protein kinase domain-containing protein n=1 Tax=Fodinicola feengrottensis TaxID=435914 RepID=A0ABN2HHR4_9ACTN